MKLTGKAKQDFNTWLVRGENYQDYEEVLQSFAFESLPDSMKWGVYQDFFYSFGIGLYAYKFKSEAIKNANETLNEILN